MPCHHLSEAKPEILKQPTRQAHAQGCDECVKAGTRWVHLRQCLLCGHVGCCDSSPGKHATRHFHTTKHPVMRSVEPGEAWGWCYIDEQMLKF